MMNTRKSLFVLSVGNIVEWYDFALYIYFATNIAQNFFPSTDTFVSMLGALATFFLGSLVRPIGGLLVGWLGDRYNHQWIINICIIVMGCSTFLVSVLPSYQTIGIWAPCILIFLRLLQGLSVGGQFPSLLTLAVQKFPNRRGFVVGLIFSISSIGFLLASFVASCVLKMHWLEAWSPSLVWRLPFGLSIVLFLMYLYLGRGNIQYEVSQLPAVQEKRPNNQGAKAKNAEGVIYALRKQFWIIVSISLLTCMAASLYYLVFTYLISVHHLHSAVSQGDKESVAFLINTFVLILICFLYPVFGHLSDQKGGKIIFHISLVSLLILTFPLMHLFSAGSYWEMFLALSIFAVFLAAIQGSISPLFALSFDEKWMATACAFAYSIGNGLSGGAPLLAEIFTHYLSYGLPIFIIILLCLGWVGMFILGV